MRIWSVHPKYLDQKGLVALWREALLAKHVLEGKTRGYKNHPQLIRFKRQKNPIGCITRYLLEVYNESQKRGYHFNKEKIGDCDFTTIEVTDGQMNYERKHLLNKLKNRDVFRYNQFKPKLLFEAHPMFLVIKGGVEDWEIV